MMTIEYTHGLLIEYMHGSLRHRAEKLDRINQLICTAGPGMLLEGRHSNVGQPARDDVGRSHAWLT